MGKFEVLDHPLIQHKLTIIRKKDCGTREFRQVVDEIATLMAYEVSRDMPLEDVEIETPMGKTVKKRLAGKKVVVVPILRAGLGMVEGILKLIPAAKVGHIGMYRDEETLQPHEYFVKMPGDLGDRDMFIVDPMLATGGSASAAVQFMKEVGCKHIKLMCIIGAPEGVAVMQKEHPDVDIYVAALDDHLNEHGYIVPGLGDAGDRIFGTK